MRYAKALRAALPSAFALAALAGAASGANAQAAGQWKDEQQVWQKICSHCHETGIGPIIKGRGLTPAYYVKVVRHGQRAMPAFRSSDIDDATLEKLANSLAASKLASSTGATQ